MGYLDIEKREKRKEKREKRKEKREKRKKETRQRERRQSKQKKSHTRDKKIPVCNKQTGTMTMNYRVCVAITYINNLAQITALS
ncbi:MAG: hypothetical protein ACRC5U_08640 [Plesiomonas sp.]